MFAEDEEFGLYLWLSFTTGGRRSEMTGLREHRFAFARQGLRFADNYLVKNGAAHREASQGWRRPVGIPRPADVRGVHRLVPPTPSYGRGLAADVPRDDYAFSRTGRQHAVEPRHHRPHRYARRVGHHELAQGTPPLLRYRAPPRRSRPQYRRGTTRSRRRLNHPEVLRAVHYPAGQRAAVIIPSQLDTLWKKERLRELYRQEPSADLDGLAAALAPLAGLDHATALTMLTEFATEINGPALRRG